MPRCQRTFRKLPAGDARPPGVALPGVGTMRWTCPYCADGETYQTLQDGDLLRFADLALAACIRDFGPPPDVKRPTQLLLGLYPECVRELSDKRYDLYLQTGSDAFQLRLQIAHEMFHRVGSQGRIFHWTHEMLACVFSVRVLETHGLLDYVRVTKEYFARDAAQLTVAQMQAAPLGDGSLYPPGLYGRAYMTGQALCDVVGWLPLCRLARFGDDFRTGASQEKVPVPDVEGWLHSLPLAEKQRAREILGITLL